MASNGWQVFFTGTPDPKPKKGSGIPISMPPLADDSEAAFWKGVATGALIAVTGKLDAPERVNELRVKLEQQAKPTIPEPMPIAPVEEDEPEEEEIEMPLSLAEEAARLRRKVR